MNLRALAIGLGTALLVVLLRKFTRRYHLPRFDMLSGVGDCGGRGRRVGLVAGRGACRARDRGRRRNPGRASRVSPSPVLSSIGCARCPAAPWPSPAWVCWRPCRLPRPFRIQTRQPLDYNRQCLAEGLANFCGGFFQCLPGSGSLTRSAINFQAGAVTRWSGVFAAAAVALVVCLFGPLAQFIPKAALAGILARDRRRPDRSAADPPRRAGEPLRRPVGPGHGPIGRADRSRVFDPHRRRPVDPDVRSPRRPAEGRGVDRRHGPRHPRPPARRSLLHADGALGPGGRILLRRRAGVGPLLRRSPRACGPAIHRAAGQADAESGHRLHGAAPALHRRDAGQGGDGPAVRRAARLRPGDAEPAFPGLPARPSAFSWKTPRTSAPRPWLPFATPTTRWATTFANIVRAAARRNRPTGRFIIRFEAPRPKPPPRASRPSRGPD